MSERGAQSLRARRLTAFMGVGVINTAVDIGAFACLYELAGLDVASANVLAFALAVANSYVLNRLVTFADRKGGSSLVGFMRFLAVAVTAMIVSTVIVYVLSQFFYPLIGKLVATAASTLINYIGSHKVVFVAGRTVSSE